MEYIIKNQTSIKEVYKTNTYKKSYSDEEYDNTEEVYYLFDSIESAKEVMSDLHQKYDRDGWTCFSEEYPSKIVRLYEDGQGRFREFAYSDETFLKESLEYADVEEVKSYHKDMHFDFFLENIFRKLARDKFNYSPCGEYVDVVIFK